MGHSPQAALLIPSSTRIMGQDTVPENLLQYKKFIIYL